MHTALLAIALATALAGEGEPPYADESPRLRLSAVGGAVFDVGSAGGGTHPVAGAELAYALESLNLGILAQGYWLGRRAAEAVSPVLLLRVDQRFETYRGLDAVLGLGIGAGKVNGWQTWFQLVLGVLFTDGPLAIGGEIGFEQLDLLRLAGTLGLRF